MKIGIVGLGLIGGSLGLKLQSLNHTIYGIANNEFNEKNQDLFRKDRIEYWHKANVYKTYGDNKKINNFLKNKVKFTSYIKGIKNTCNWFMKNKNLFN